jgi:hypothetical protein
MTTTPPTTTTTTMSSASASLIEKTPLLGPRAAGNASAPPVTTTSTTSPLAPTTTTTAASTALPADRSETETEGYFDPPLETSGHYDVSGTGATEVSVLWSAPVYLTMTLSCPGGSQTVGGTTAMDASVPEATGCQATVSEPTSESTSLTYTVAFGPANG